MTAPVRVARLVSGGQTGVDRAALDAALAADVRYGGWCPAGGWAEDRPDPPGLLADYPGLRETPSADPADRTRRNVRDSDAVLVVRDPGVPSPGTDLTIATARQLGRPCLAVAGGREDLDSVRRWLARVEGERGAPPALAVAGPRESEQRGAYAAARRLLDALLAPAGLSP
ncbi:putative molybdenum carrier protein [Nocardioides sp. GY 10113]|uniref:YpsA SLOG family protein n=1 Tax=Nocardioides sp. GY 10113 TaxID=2569761 RepID=UPI00197D8672|nr:putative molybdenum carrier protein [Nocardioides sp. GY 10113]